jgi:hypothetical protein
MASEVKHAWQQTLELHALKHASISEQLKRTAADKKLSEIFDALGASPATATKEFMTYYEAINRKNTGFWYDEVQKFLQQAFIQCVRSQKLLSIQQTVLDTLAQHFPFYFELRTQLAIGLRQQAR